MKRRHSAASPAAGRAGSSRAAILWLGVVAAALTPGPARAGASGLSVSGQWFRMIMRSRPAAGYFTLSNATATPRTLVGAASPGCGMLMLHETVSRSGEESMVMVPSVTVPAHGKVAFAPGGYHLMCMSPTSLMQRGQSVPVTLRLADGESLQVNFPVHGATGK
jgi:periplasmic copper chaperone A